MSFEVKTCKFHLPRVVFGAEAKVSMFQMSKCFLSNQVTVSFLQDLWMHMEKHTLM